MANTKQLPGMVNIISLAYYISAGISLIVSLLWIFGGIMWTTILEIFSDPDYIAQGGEALPDIVLQFGATLFYVIGIIALALAVFEFFIAKRLRTGTSWARMSAGVIAILGVALGITSIPSGIVSLAWNGIIVYYLFFNQEVIQYFSQTSPYEKKTIGK